MIRWRTGTVSGIAGEWPGVREILVDVDGDGAVRALAYVALVGTPEAGERVLLNTTALSLGLGTGGHALVVAIPDRLPPDPDGAPGLLVKARYTPSQVSVMGVDDQQSPHHELIAAATSIDALPVVVADLHSALPAILAGVRADRPDARVAYVMTDGGALPLWYSRTVAGIGHLLCGTVTAGQAFGGELESVTVHTALLAAKHVLRADVAIVAQGPGNLGTGTPWGFSGVAAGEAVNAVAALHGAPIGALRISGADPRERHRGVSHHCLTAFGRVALAAAELPVPTGLSAELDAAVRADLAPLTGRHHVVEVDSSGLLAALTGLPVPLSTMGRSLHEDVAYFLAGAAAGRHAASRISRAAGR